MQLTGRIKMIGQTQEVSQSFRKRELVVTTEEQYPQHILIEFHQDKCDVLNSYQVGQQATISVNLRGKEYQDKQTGQTKYFNTIQGWKINAVGQPQPAYGQPMQQQGYGQQPQQGFQHQQPQQQFQQQQPQQNNEPPF